MAELVCDRHNLPWTAGLVKRCDQDSSNSSSLWPRSTPRPGVKVAWKTALIHHPKCVPMEGSLPIN